MRLILSMELLEPTTGYFITPIKGGKTALISFVFTLPSLKSGSYSLSADIWNCTIESHQAYGWIENLAVFIVENKNACFELFDVPIDIHAQVLN